MGYGIWDMGGIEIWDMGYGIWAMRYGIWAMGYSCAGIWACWDNLPLMLI